MGDFYGTEIEIWARFGPVGITEKKIWANHERLLRPVFSSFHGQKRLKENKNMVALALKTCIE